MPVRIHGGFDDVKNGTRTAFREFNSKGKVVEYSGLETFVSTSWNSIPMAIFDNHNFAFAFWCEAFASGVFSKGATLVHIDMHSDLWPNANDFDLSRSGDTEYVENFTHAKTSVGNYIEPAMRAGMFSRFVRIEGEGDLNRELEMVQNAFYDDSDLIVNLDLDFFAPDLADISFELKRRTIREFAYRSKYITIATSPCFIDQEQALFVLNRIF